MSHFTAADVEAHQQRTLGGVQCTCGLRPTAFVGHSKTCPKSLPGYLPREVVAAAGAAEAPKLKQGRKMNRTEAEYALILKAERPGCEIKYEAYTLKLANGVRYTPDFAICFPDGTVEFVEVKGSFIFSRALQKPRVAATMFPHHRFYLAQKLSGSWTVTEIKKDDS